jgi:phosphatidylserine/phosphatidylglycerophosphate/cardiolipin synthase-like enzyme
METKNFSAGFALCFLICIIYVNFFTSQGNAGVDPVFSPGSEGEIIALMRHAQTGIDLQMYVFTNEELALELADAAQRGVRVRVILEKRAESYNMDEIVAGLKDAGVQVKWASEEFKLTHSKMMIIDLKKVFLGSINFSQSAVDKNREVAVVLEGDVIGEYIDVFENDWELGVWA